MKWCTFFLPILLFSLFDLFHDIFFKKRRTELSLNLNSIAAIDEQIYSGQPMNNCAFLLNVNCVGLGMILSMFAKHVFYTKDSHQLSLEIHGKCKKKTTWRVLKIFLNLTQQSFKFENFFDYSSFLSLGSLENLERNYKWFRRNYFIFMFPRIIKN